MLSAMLCCAEETRYYQKLQTGEISCLLCPRACVLREGQTGVCRTRKNVKGKLESLVYGKLVSVNADPIEKKPLFHFLPNTATLSIATAGCNLRCNFCQNWEISQAEPADVRAQIFSPEQLVAAAKENACPSISYTYSEPVAFYDYMYDTSMLARKKGVKNVLVTCGYINPEPLKDVSKFLDAANVDLKGFSDNTYRWVSAARLAPVLETLKILKENDVWLEVGYLVIPSVNDSTKEIKDMVTWVRANLGKDVPLHFLRFFPQHKMTNLPPTPVAKLEEAYKLAKDAGINYVYIGNVPGSTHENTYCPKCGKMIVGRKGYFIEQFDIVNGRCRFCGNKIPGVWK
jgi:pyruvate formate lyase activating enzyme